MQLRSVFDQAGGTFADIYAGTDGGESEHLPASTERFGGGILTGVTVSTCRSPAGRRARWMPPMGARFS